MFGKRIENRILVGVTSFVAIMVLVGWVAINEGGRMLAFEEQFGARSVERGAALFTTNCTLCHGPDARGILGRAPALNNPQLFGHDFVGVFDDQIKTLTDEMVALQAQLGSEGLAAERADEINARLGTNSIAAELYTLANPLVVEDAASEETTEPIGDAVVEATPADSASSEAAVEPTADATPQAEEATSLDVAPEVTVGVAVPTAQRVLLDEQAMLETELATLQTELSAEGLAAERVTEIDTRIAAINTRLGADSIPSLLIALQAQRDATLNSFGPAIDKGYSPDTPSRLDQLEWAGSLDAFIYTTLIHGRPLSGQYWPQGKTMPAWSQAAGGPLRNDQLQDLTNYILNFDKGDNWTLEDLFAVNQFAIIPGAVGGGMEGPPVAPDPTAVDVAAIATELMALAGDPQSGQTLYNGFSLSCAGCHVNGAGVTAPAVDGTWTRVLADRLTLPQYAGYTGEQYLVESILLPGNFTVPPYTAGAMLPNFGTRLDIQMLADIVAYLKSQDGPSPE